MKPYVYPDPLIPAEIPYRDLVAVDSEHSKDPSVLVKDGQERFRAAVDPVWFENRFVYEGECDFCTYRKWEDEWRRIPYEQLARAFSFPELVQMWIGSFIMSDLGEYIEKNHNLLWKVQNCLWQYGFKRDWNDIIATLDGLRRLRIDIDGFEVKLTHSRSINTAGSAKHVEGLYLDAAFGLLLYHGGKHVLTVGFAPSRYGILVAQVQLRNKKGNRFLYRLGQHYVDMALDILARAFVGQDLWLIDGAAAVKAVKRSYGNQPCSMTAEDEARIQALYDRPLAAYDRPLAAYDRVPLADDDSYRTEGSKGLWVQGREYYRLVPKSAIEKAA